MTHEAFQLAASAIMYIAIGLAVVIHFSQERTRTNALVAGATFMVGLAIGTTPIFGNRVDAVHPDILARLQGLFEVAAIALYAAFMLGLLASSSLTGNRARTVRVCGYTGYGLAVWHAIASFAWPAQRLNDYELSLADPGALSQPGFWLFAIFWLIAAIPFGTGWVLLSLGDIDPAEARRAQAIVAASGFSIAMTVTPPTITGLIAACWITAFLYGQLQYTSARAERGVFLSRFLSPRVTDLVDTRGLAETMKPHQAVITVVCADLRGFTAYSEGVPSQAVVDLLTEYYDAVGEVAGRYGATITNYAGDGVLILVGAPIEDPSHAGTGIRLGRDLLVAVEPVLARWQTRMHTLGLGVGVASGSVTVGAITAETRMEYTAIGSPVNLAARLCAAAAPDEVLIDAEAARLSNTAGVRPRGEMTIKGFSEPQQVYEVVPA